MKPMNEQHYYEAFGSNDSYSWKIYHYDETGNKEIIVAKSHHSYNTKDAAYDAAVEWLEDNNIDAEMM